MLPPTQFTIAFIYIQYIYICIYRQLSMGWEGGEFSIYVVCGRERKSECLFLH